MIHRLAEARVSDLLKQTSETLAGRIAFLELTPLLVEEIVEKKRGERDRLWLRGGFPDSFLAAGDAASVEWREAFIGTYLERDIPSLGPRIPAETLRRFWTMLAHEQGTLLNAAAVAAGLGVSGQTVGRYLDLMVDLLLVRRLQPWSANSGRRRDRSRAGDSSEGTLGHRDQAVIDSFVIQRVLSGLQRCEGDPADGRSCRRRDLRLR